MDSQKALDGALRQIERTERRFGLGILGAAIWEALLLGAFLFGADFSNRTHVLLLISVVGGYTLILLGLVLLGMHVSRVGQQVLRALEQRFLT